MPFFILIFPTVCLQVFSLYVRTNARSGVGVLPPGVDLTALMAEKGEDEAVVHLQDLSRELETSTVGMEVSDGAASGVKPELDYISMLNGVLPSEIRFLSWAPVDHSFSARFSCTGRLYRYYFLRGKMDLLAMADAASRLVGEHDFRNFCKMDAEHVHNFVRQVRATRIAPCDPSLDPSSPWTPYFFEVSGSAFLWHQVRCFMSILFMVGSGEEDPEVVDALLDLEATPRKPVYALADPEPLVLYQCTYDHLDWQIDERASLRAVSPVEHIAGTLAMKAALVQDMLRGMVDLVPGIPPTTLDGVRPTVGNRSKEPKMAAKRPGKHTSLLDRVTESTYEERIESLKRRKVGWEPPSPSSRASKGASGEESE